MVCRNLAMLVVHSDTFGGGAASNTYRTEGVDDNKCL